MDITVLVCTYNRCGELGELLDSALTQETGGAFTYEVLVVDNNSSDGTRGLVEGLIAEGHGNLRYLFEGRQGKSFALNTGLGAARGSVYTIADDDLILPKNYLRQIHEAFRAHPEVSIVGGKVLPLWSGEPPAWLTARHWSPLALADYGQEAFYTGESRQVCLLAGAFRLHDVLAAKGYQRGLDVSKNRIGGAEDADLITRLYRDGRQGLYLPRLAVYHKVPAVRLSKSYHRRWHKGHGRNSALMRDEQIEASMIGRLFDVPAHMFKQAVVDTAHLVAARLKGDQEGAFLRESRLWFFAGFFEQRCRDYFLQKRAS